MFPATFAIDQMSEANMGFSGEHTSDDHGNLAIGDIEAIPGSSLDPAPMIESGQVPTSSDNVLLSGNAQDLGPIGKAELESPKTVAELNARVDDVLQNGWKFTPGSEDPNEQLGLSSGHGFTQNEFNFIKSLKARNFAYQKTKQRQAGDSAAQFLPRVTHSYTDDETKIMPMPDLTRELDTFYAVTDMTGIDTARKAIVNVITPNQLNTTDRDMINDEGYVEGPASFRTGPSDGMTTEPKQPFVDSGISSEDDIGYLTPASSPALHTGVVSMKPKPKQSFTDSGIFTDDYFRKRVNAMTPTPTPTLFPIVEKTGESHGVSLFGDGNGNGNETSDIEAPYDLQDFTPEATEYNKAMPLEPYIHSNDPNDLDESADMESDSTVTYPELQKPLRGTKSDKKIGTASYQSRPTARFSTSRIQGYPTRLQAASSRTINPIGTGTPTNRVLPSNAAHTLPRPSAQRLANSVIALTTTRRLRLTRARAAQAAASASAASAARTNGVGANTTVAAASSPSPQAHGAIRALQRAMAAGGGEPPRKRAKKA